MAFEGLVIQVHDGDTMTVINENNAIERIRLYRIDSPEMRGSKWQYQPYANESKAVLSSLCLGAKATIIRKGTSYDRTVGEVICNNKQVSVIMISNGSAWAYKYTALKSQKLLQDKARAEKQGLWALDKPIEPLMWRQGVK